MVLNVYNDMLLDTPHPNVIAVYNPYDYVLLAVATIVIIAVVATAICIAKKIKKK